MDSKERLEDHEMSGSTTNNSLGVPASTSSSNPPSSRSSHRRVSFDALSKAVHKRGISGYGNIPNSPATTSTPATGQIGSNGAGFAPGPSLSPVPMNIGNSLPTSPVRASAGYRHHPTGVHPMSNTSSNNIPNAAYIPPLNVGVTGGSNNVNGSGFYSHSHPNSHPHASSSSVASPPFHSQRPLMESLYSEFPFPALSALNRSRLLHLLEYQCRICEQVDKESLLHYRTLIQAIQSLNLKGGVYNFSFVHSSSIAHDLLGLSNPRSHYVTRLTVSHLLVILEKVRNSTSPNLAHPQSLPLALLETGIYYKPEEEQAKSMQLSPYVYHRTLAFLSLLMNLHIHQLTLSRILELLHGIDIHLDYWMSHQALTSLPKPYRLWKWFQYNWLGGVHRQSAASFASDFSGLHSPVKKRRTGGGGVAAGGDEKYEDEPQGSFGFPPNASSSSSSFSSSSASASTNPYSKWSLMAARNVRELVALKKLWTTRCGRIALRMHKLQQWLNDDFGKKPQTKTAASASIPSASISLLHVPSNTAAAVAFHRHIELNELYFSKIYRYTLGEELHASSTSSSAPTIQQKIYGLVAQFGSYEHYLTNFESVFVRQLQREINLRRKPHHLFEKWHYYTAGGLLVLGAAVYALRNQHEVRALGVETMKSLQFFLNEHLVEPLQNIYETTFKTFHDRSLFSTNAETLAQSKDNLSSMLSEFAHKHASELSAYEERQRAEYLTSIEERARNADMNLVMKPYNREIQHPIRSLLFGDLMHGLLIQVQKVKVDSEAGMLALDQILKSNQINFNILATIPFILLTYGVYDVTNKWILRSSWSSKGVQQQVRVCKNILSELEQIYILHLTNMSVGVEAPPSSSSSSGRSSYAPSSHLHPLSHMRSRSPLHNAIQTLSIDEFASLCSQEQEDEDETLRLHSGGASINSSNSNLSSSSNPSQASMSGTEIFGNLDHVTNDLQLESEDEEDEEEQPYDTTNNRPIHSEVSRTLFTPPPPPQQSQSQSHASNFSSLRRPSVMGLSNHVYGHTLLLIHSLSLHLSTLPLSSAFTSNLLVRSGGASDPRHVLHKDLVLLASDELTPEQKYRWIQHMWHAYSFLAGI